MVWDYNIEEIIASVETSPVSRISFLFRRERGGYGKDFRLGVFPSSFNPITIAHMEIVLKAKEMFQLHEILLLLDRRNVDKEIFGASIEERLEMLWLVYRGNPDISVGIASHGLFVEKVPAIIDAYSCKPDIHFIVGQDTIERIMDRRYYNRGDESLSELFANSRFIVVPREERGEDNVRSLFSRPENRTYGGGIYFLFLPNHFFKISSTLVRELISEGKPFDHLVPQEVSTYIREKGLYRNQFQ